MDKKECKTCAHRMKAKKKAVRQQFGKYVCGKPLGKGCFVTDRWESRRWADRFVRWLMKDD